MGKGMKAGFAFGVVAVFALAATFVVLGLTEAPNPKEAKRDAALAESEAQYERDVFELMERYGYESTNDGNGIQTKDGSEFYWRKMRMFETEKGQAKSSQEERDAAIKDEYWSSLTFEEMEDVYFRAVDEYCAFVRRNQNRGQSTWNASEPERNRLEKRNRYIQRKCQELFPETCRFY